MTEYARFKIVEMPAEDILIISVRLYGDQLWTKGRLRKRANCADCHNDIETENSFRPSTNAGNRADRLCLYCIKTLVEEYQKELKNNE